MGITLDHTDRASLSRRSHFLAHQVQLGFYLRDAKIQAVLSGDLSGRVVHPAVVHLAQMVGAFLWKVHHQTDVLILSEDIEMLKILNCLEYPPDSATLVMVYTVIGEYLLFKRQPDAARMYLVKATQVMSPQELQLCTPNLHTMLAMGEPDEDTKEFIAAISQLMYVDKASTMVMGMVPFLDAEYDEQIRTLSVSDPVGRCYGGCANNLDSICNHGWQKTPPSFSNARALPYYGKLCIFRGYELQQHLRCRQRASRRLYQRIGTRSTGGRWKKRHSTSHAFTRKCSRAVSTVTLSPTRYVSRSPSSSCCPPRSSYTVCPVSITQSLDKSL